jgi:CubicO group peptidase (beta-lactamase class C family)
MAQSWKPTIAAVDLSAWLDKTLGRRHPVVAVGVVRHGEISVATRGAGVDADYEIGSISKGITGLLYVQALERGEITPDCVLADFLPIGDVPAGRVTLSSITVHRSGLPRLPKAMHAYRRSWQALRRGTNPYGDTLEQLLAQTRTVELGKPKARYSNLGFELLGHALARAACTTYAELAGDKVFAPLGLDSMYVPVTSRELRATALTGTGRYGDHRDAWTGEAVGPAGGIRAAITDMARLAAALLDGSAPGVAAIEPTADFMRGARVGAGWITLDVKRPRSRRQVTFHDGGTGGFRSVLGIDRAAHSGVIVLTATARSVTSPGLRLLTDEDLLS